MCMERAHYFYLYWKFCSNAKSHYFPTFIISYQQLMIIHQQATNWLIHAQILESTICNAILHRKKCHFVVYRSYVFHSHLWQSLFRTQFKRTQIILVYVNRTSYVYDNFQSINCVKYVLGHISRSMQFQRKLWELFCICPAYGVWIPQHTPQHTQVNTWQHLWVWLCTTWETRTHQTWDNYNWTTPPYGTAFFWLVFTKASKEKKKQ